jgi:hypothetical protein
MKKFKTLMAVLMIALFAMPTLNSCRKGEEDPLLSLRSRKARLAGEWTLVSGSETYTYSSGAVSYTYTTTYNGTTATYTGGGSSSSTSPYTEVIEFAKDNTFKATVTDDGDILVVEGFWSFLEGWDEIKDKEAIVIRINKEVETSNGAAVTTTYTGDQMPYEILRFKRLSNKECTIIVDGNETGSATASQFSEKNYESN